MTPAEFDITMVPGKMFRMRFQLANTNVTGYGGEFAVRHKESGALQCEARTTGGEGGTVTFPAPGTVAADGWGEILILASQSTGLVVGSQKWDFDIIPPSGAEYRQQYFRGGVNVLDRMVHS